jgi:hypothetical protein
LLLWYNYLRFGHPFVASYHSNKVNTKFDVPLSVGLPGLLISPGRGLFVFNVIAIPGLVGLVLLWAKDRALAALVTLLIVPRLIFFAKWNAWHGGVSWGPRFLMPIVPLFVLGAFSLTRSNGSRPVIRRAGRVAVALAALLSIPVSYLSVRVPYEQWHNTLFSPVLRAPLFSLPKAQTTFRPLFHLEIWSWRYSTLHGNFLLLRARKAQMAPAWWPEHRAGVGWLVLLGFLGGAVLTIVAASIGDREAAGRGAPNRTDLRVFDDPPQPERHPAS